MLLIKTERIETVILAHLLLLPGIILAGNIILVENKVPRASIIFGYPADQDTETAAFEFNDYIEKITGARLPMWRIPAEAGESDFYVLIGQSDSLRATRVDISGLPRQGFHILTQDNKLIIIGGSGMGALFGVYHFLEKYCGVRWLWPGELGEVVPQQQTLALDSIDETDAPDYLWRSLGPGGHLWKEWTTGTLRGVEMVQELKADGVDLFDSSTIREYSALYEKGEPIPRWDKIMAINDYWMERERWIDAHRNDFILSYRWVKSNVRYRKWNPIVPIAKIFGNTKPHQYGTVLYGY